MAEKTDNLEQAKQSLSDINKLLDVIDKMYTRAEVEAIVKQVAILERERAMTIAESFMNKYDKSYKEKHAASQQMAFVQSEISEASRYIMNSISGRTGLNINQPLSELVNTFTHLLNK